MMKAILKWIFALLLIAILGFYGFTFSIREGYGAIVTRFGEITLESDEAGLYGKLPWPFDQVISLDLRVQMLDSGYTETLTRDKRNIILQTYMVWQIEDLSLFYKSIGDMDVASNYLNDLLANAKNGVMGGYDLSSLVSTDETLIQLDEIESALLEAVATPALENYGISVQQVSVKRLALPEVNMQSVYDQMTTERQKYVTTLLSEGERDAEMIKSSADTEVAQILAEAQTEAAQIDADTEKQVSEIYANAYEQNPELFTILQQLSALESSVSTSTVMVMESSESPFQVLLQEDEVE